MLPLFAHRSGPLRVVRFADAGVSDYNAPVLGPDAPVDPAGAKALWKAIQTALGDADLVNFTKMPTEVEGLRPSRVAAGVRPVRRRHECALDQWLMG